MKILIYASVFHPGVGGIENITLSLAKEFEQSGHDVKVITEQAQDPKAPIEGIEVVHFSRLLHQLKLFFWSDVVYMPNISLKGAPLWLFNPFKKLVISHNDFHNILASDYKSKLKKLMTRMIAINISVSNSVARALKVQSKVIHNSYNDQVFRIYEEEERSDDLLFVGRLVSQKGCALLVEACKGLRRPFRLSIVGDGVELPRLKAQVTALGLDDRISFHGFMRDEALARMMCRHRTMIVPSLGAEGFGIVALEGLACGCRMIVSDAGGLPEAVGGFGNVFPAGDVGALTALLERALTEAASDGTRAGPVRAYLDTRSAKNVACEYLKVLA